MTMAIGKLFMQNKPEFLTANWNAPKNVRTLITTRIGGYSNNNCASFNLARHVGEELKTVEKNRELLATHLPDTPTWLNQVHSDLVLNLDHTIDKNSIKTYDAAITSVANKVCVVMTADCIPILLTNTQGNFVAAIHAGWRGVENQIINNTIKASNVTSKDIIAYIGPAICSQHFEVGQDVYEVFIKLDPANKQFFKGRDNSKFDCDLVGIAKLQLINHGLVAQNIYLSNLCTVCNNDKFYSYRKEKNTGRFASIIWFE